MFVLSCIGRFAERIRCLPAFPHKVSAVAKPFSCLRSLSRENSLGNTSKGNIAVGTAFSPGSADARGAMGERSRTSRRHSVSASQVPAAVTPLVVKPPSRDQERLASKQQSFCKNAVRTMLKDENSVNFSRPVSELWDLNDLPDYTVKVKHPMDLGTVQGNLDAGAYSSEETGLFDPNLFVADVRLTFQNALIYNEVGTDMHNIATSFLGWFDTFMENLPLQDEKSAKSISGVPASVKSDGRADGTGNGDVVNELETLRAERASLESKIATLDAENNIPLSDDDRIQLRDEIEDLPWEKCKPIVDILKAEVEAVLSAMDDPAPDFVDLDLDQVQPHLLRKIHDYLHPSQDPERRDLSKKLSALSDRINLIEAKLPPGSRSIARKRDRSRERSKDRDRDRRRRKK